MPALPKLSDRTLPAAFERALSGGADRPALIADGVTWTYRQWHARALRLAAGLRDLGVSRGDPVALLLDNSADFVHAFSATGLMGAVEVPVNTAYKGRFLTHVLNDSGARVLIVEEACCARLAAVASELTALETVIVRGGDGSALPDGRWRVLRFDALDACAPMSPRPRDPADLMAFMYTSGTTGPSKGVLVSHAHAYTYASREDQELPRDDDRILVTLPLFHLAGQWYGVYQSLIHQACCVLEPRFSPGRFWSSVRENGVTCTTLLGAMAELLQQQPVSDDDADNPLRLAVMAPLASDVPAFRDRFGIDVAAVYGMSEIGAVMNGPPRTIVGGEAGFGREEYELAVVDERGDAVPTGEVGELRVRGLLPHITMTGYHDLPEKTEQTIRDGWIRTGDAFRQDDQGRFYFVDRLKDALRRRGENVSSFDVESVVNEHPSVFESAVVGVPSEFTEDEIKVVVVAREGEDVDPVELTRFLVDRLPYFMVPRYVEHVAELPKTPTQKVQKNVLRESGVHGAVWDREAAGIELRRGD